MNGATHPTGLRADSPLKLLAPRRRTTGGAPQSSWVFTSTYGGGLLAGDAIDLDVACGPGTTCLLGTQASTKVYRSPNGRPSRQSVTARVADGAALAVLPDPVTCFAEAVFEQRQRFDLSAGASLLLVDWFTSGRRAAGERWAFDRYFSRFDVYRSGRLALREAVLLDPADGPLAAPARMGRTDCVAVAVLLGPRLRAAAAAVLADVAARPVPRQTDLMCAASPSCDGGAMVRVAGTDTETVGRWLRERLACASELLGEDPWARKF